MISRSYTLGLASVAITLISFGLDTAKANAQTNYEFSATYDTVVTIDPSFRPDIGITRATITGENADAPYGLSKFLSNTYGQFDPTTNISYFNADASAFGLENQPLLSDRYYGGSNELYGTANDQAKFDFVNGTVNGAGTITLTGGEGLFKDAVGNITFTQNDRLTSTDLTAPFKGKAVLKFSVQTPKAVPEPNATAGVIGMGFVGLSFLLGKYSRKLKFRR
ncbi:hypothetical protein WA1_17125 [Scytonema hofmannii PCC 7110]|uniref:PEP-CTERM sorting domain-containing protein n=1 Tax=Scytonema hofmannii PCC 7110 TaxID=128403 RepID=A0A139XAN1_9CYAN|nr:hypothetical protein [Scytonema hofmannii]KYC41751.1 hypothetical protein WA1_17125 [Scytonema hofmannii PCC 7110]